MMHFRFLLLIPCLCASLVAAPGPATGQNVPPEKLEAFERHVAAGAELYKDEKFHEALEEFRRARNIADHPKLSYKIGRTLEKLNRCAKARSAYQRYLDYEGLDDTDREQANQQLEGLQDCKPLGRLEFTCVPEHATVDIAQQTFDCPAGVDLEAGTYQVNVSADGHETRSVAIDVEPETTTERTVDLTGSGMPSDWRPYATWGGIGLGGALFIGGLASDISSIARHDRIADAAARGDSSRLEELDRQARGAKTRTIALYTSGVLLATGGLVLYFLDSSPDASASLLSPDDRPPAGVKLGAGHIGAYFKF